MSAEAKAARYTSQMMDSASLTPLELARELDAAGRVVETAQAYEHVISAGDAPLEAYLNLIGLYFEFLDPTWWDNLEAFSAEPDDDTAVTEEFLRTVGDGLQRALDRAEDEFGEHPELTFWREYTLFIHYDGEPFGQLAEELLASGQTRVPLLYLLTYGAPEISERYRSQAETLLEDLEEPASTRERYVARSLFHVLRDSGEAAKGLPDEPGAEDEW